MSRKSKPYLTKLDAHSYVKKLYNTSFKKELSTISEKLNIIAEPDVNLMAYSMIDGIYHINEMYACFDSLYSNLVKSLVENEQKAIEQKMHYIKEQLLEEHLEVQRIKIFEVSKELYGKMEVATTMFEVTYGNFEQILANSQYTIFYFSSIACPPCKNLKPKIIALSKEYQSLVTVGEIRSDKDLKMVNHYKIQSVPTLLFFKEGKLVNRTTGDMPLAVLKKCIQDMIKKINTNGKERFK